MNSELIKFCMERGLLLDKDVLSLFSEEDVESVKLIIEGIRSKTNSTIITRSLFNQNKEKVSELLMSLPEERKKNLSKLKIKLGLSIEITQEEFVTENNLEENSNNLEGEIVLNEGEKPKLEIENKEKNFDKEENKEKNFPKENFEGVKVLTQPVFTNKKLEVGDFVSYFRNRFSEMRNILQERGDLNNLVSINKIGGERQAVSLIGIVSDKKTTKNKNILLDVEDLSGKIRVLISNEKKDLYSAAEEIVLDSVVGFNGFGNKEIIFANNVVFPDARLPERRNSPVEECALFVGDLHFGSKLFMRDNFLKFIDYLNGNSEEVKKIKYLFLVGDVVTGVGVYPGQEYDLEVEDLEEQFSKLAELLGKIRKDIRIIITPGNHDGVRLMEPQPMIDEKFAWPLYELENVIFAPNPAVVNIGSGIGFSGFNVLAYHGFSFTYYANTLSRLMKIRAMNSPEEIMKYLLKNRHLAPSHTSVQYFPLEEDALVIKDVPDIFVSAHTHKSAVTYYNNILVISTSCWEEMTPYQEKFGNTPDHCKVPMFNLKTRAVKILDFE